jgi:hypothetical protein
MNKTIELTPAFYERLAKSIATLESMAERNRAEKEESQSPYFRNYCRGKSEAYARSASMMKEIFRIEFDLEIHNLKTHTDGDTRI